MSTTSQGPSRRTLVKGAAWSVPVVAVAGAAPAWAASPGCTDTGLCFSGAGIHKCCDAGTKYYWADITFENTSNVDTTVSFTFTLVTSASGSLDFSGGGDVPANSSRTFRVVSDTVTNCSDGTYEAFVISFTDASGATGQSLVPGGSTGGSTCPPELSGLKSKTLVDEAPADVKVDEAPASADVATTDSAPAPAPAAPVEPAPAPAPADDASATSAP